ncbi:MAG: DUF3426 domain-containing protein [Pseudomonadota bacterium]
MFINCPYCRALVATDPVTDQAPTHCPHCDSLLRRDPSTPVDASDEGERPPLDLAELLNVPPDAPIEARIVGVDDDADARIDIDARPVADMQADAGAEAVDANAVEPDTGVIPADGPDAESAPIATAPAAARARGARAMPSFVRRNADAPTGPRERWVPIAVAALALLLALQLLLADRARLAGDARWRPVLQTLCAALGCDLPPWREPGAFTLLQRDVRQHPSLPGTLRVSATFRNDARWSQPWPRLTLTLSDANGRAAGERSFRAEEYLGGAPDQPELASGESATVAMDIVEPAPGIVAYDFGFR